jgi:glutamyl-Q tRNA(Asp) synthetase
MSAPYVGRFAPSPTGLLHAGSLVAALASWLDARAHGGRWLVRIEDLDTPRNVAGAAEAIVAQLESVGLRADGAVVRQSQRTARYQAALQTLEAKGRAYPCACSRRDLALAVAAPAGTSDARAEAIYPGTCRAGLHGKAPRSVRLQVEGVEGSGEARIDWLDRRLGAQHQDVARAVGDFVLKRADGVFAYQLAVVVDDAAQSITDVVRGADLLASTPRQIFLQRLLSVASPRYLHVPVAVDATGRKLSKETGAAALPASALSALLTAWRFLEQPVPDEVLQSVAEFWSWAQASWRPAQLPRVAMRPAPRRV